MWSNPNTTRGLYNLGLTQGIKWMSVEIGWRSPTYAREGYNLVRERLVSSNCVLYNLVGELYTGLECL